MRVVVAMPWRPTPARVDAHDFVRRWLGEHLPDAPVLEVDTDLEPYNLAAARNEGVRQAGDADIVVIFDADTVLEPQVLHTAIAAAGDGRVHLPFTRQKYLTSAETDTVLAGGAVDESRVTVGNGCCYVCTPAAYWKAGGHDERFRGWGGEDEGFVAAASTLVGLERHEGLVMSLWHADEHRPIGTEAHRPNAALANRYWMAEGNPTAMLDLIAER